MVVQGIIALALALPTGALFGIGYGTGVRIGYEQIYPLLFPKDAENRNVTPTVENVKTINHIYNAIGGKEASQMGIANGISDAMSALNNNPDFQDLVALESKLSGLTQSNFEKAQLSGRSSDSTQEASLSDFKDSQGNFISATDPALYTFILKEQGNNAQTETNFNERKVKLRILIQKMSQSQIKDAYSDMLSGRLQPTWTQNDSQFKQILTLEFKKLVGNPNLGKSIDDINLGVPTSTIEAKPAPQEGIEYSEWLASFMPLFNEINRKKSMLRQTSPASRNTASIGQQLDGYRRGRTNLLKIFSLGRNSTNLSIKLQARKLYSNYQRQFPYEPWS